MNKTPRELYAPWPSTRKYAIETRSGLAWGWFAGAASAAEAIRYLKACRKTGTRARAVDAAGTVHNLATRPDGAVVLVSIPE